jgi:hypothetical protein
VPADGLAQFAVGPELEFAVAIGDEHRRGGVAGRCGGREKVDGPGEIEAAGDDALDLELGVLRREDAGIVGFGGAETGALVASADLANVDDQGPDLFILQSLAIGGHAGVDDAAFGRVEEVAIGGAEEPLVIEQRLGVGTLTILAVAGDAVVGPEGFGALGVRCGRARGQDRCEESEAAHGEAMVWHGLDPIACRRRHVVKLGDLVRIVELAATIVLKHGRRDSNPRPAV